MKPRYHLRDSILTIIALAKQIFTVFTIKTAVTLAVVFVFLLKAFRGAETGGDFMVVLAVVVTYWLCEKTKGSDEK